MRRFIAVGLGHVWKEFYAEVLEKLENENVAKLLGTVDPAVAHQGERLAHDMWHVRTVREIPEGFRAPDVAPMVLTPDHYGVIEELAEMGFKTIFCEKPLVSRLTEIEKVEALVARHNLKLYAADFYLPKVLGLQFAMGRLAPSDPRYPWLTISNPSLDFRSMLGEIEGVGVQVVEAGDFSLPDIAERPYLATSKEIGGMILDLVTHVCGPLYQSRLLDGWTVLDASLSRLSNITSGHIVKINNAASEVEMFVTALVEANGIPVHLAFGKVPIRNGGLWSIEVHGTHGAYYSGLRSNQATVLAGNDGGVVTFTLNMTAYEFVVREALLYFEGLLPGFDGNYGAFSTSMKIGQAIVRKYQENVI